MKHVTQDKIIAKHESETFVITNLAHNMLSSADYFLYYYDKLERIRFGGQYLVNLAMFYELFFKYKMTKIHPSLIWKKIGEYNPDKHSTADFESIKSTDVLKYALNMEWVTASEYDLINKIFGIRNAIAHFSLCEENADGNIPVAYFESDFDKKHYDLIKRLLLENKAIFQNDLDYNRIIIEYWGI